MRLSRTLEASLALAVREARTRRHEYLCIEHVLYALLHDESVAEVIRACGGDVEALKRDLDAYLDEHLERLPEGRDVMPQQTLGFQRILQRAAAHVQSSGRDEVNGTNVIINNSVRTAVEKWKFSPIVDASGPRCVDTEILVTVGR